MEVRVTDCCHVIYTKNGGMFSLMVTSEEMELATRVQILDTVVCVSLSTNALEKSMNPSLPAMGKL